MSNALPGNHYCDQHQGNHSHYATHNCEYCIMRNALADIAYKFPMYSSENQTAAREALLKIGLHRPRERKE